MLTGPPCPLVPPPPLLPRYLSARGRTPGAPAGARCGPAPPLLLSSPLRPVPSLLPRESESAADGSRALRSGAAPLRAGATMATSIGNFFRRSLRRSGRRGEGGEGTAPCSGRCRCRYRCRCLNRCRWHHRGRGCGSRRCRRSGDFPGQRSAATPGGTVGTGTGGAAQAPLGPLTLESPARTVCLGTYRISWGCSIPPPR